VYRKRLKKLCNRDTMHYIEIDIEPQKNDTVAIVKSPVVWK